MQVHIPGFMFAVQEHFLEDVLHAVGYAPQRRAENVRLPYLSLSRNYFLPHIP